MPKNAKRIWKENVYFISFIKSYLTERFIFYKFLEDFRKHKIVSKFDRSVNVLTAQYGSTWKRLEKTK